jgi:hypothetical protein
MSKTTKKFRYAGLNFIAPGIGQLAMKKWIRGSLQLLASIACIVWMVVALVNIMVGNIYLILDGKEVDSHILDVFIPMGVLALIWIYSYIDLIFFCSLPAPKDEGNDYQI